MCVFIHVTVIVRVQDEDYRIFFVNSYSAIARKVICAVRSLWYIFLASFPGPRPASHHALAVRRPPPSFPSLAVR